jgi:serine phosphatase RsbU (regulator of sigma subunit)
METYNKNAIIDVLEIALKRETAAFNFYSKASLKSPYPETRTLLQQLAEEERKHQYFVRKELKKIESLLSGEDEQARMTAEHVQFALPDEIDFKRLQSIPGLDIRGFSIPTELFGGDFLDTVTLERDGKSRGLGVFLYDVMGHGIEATQLKACARRLFSDLRDELEEGVSRLDEPYQVMSYINRHIMKDCERQGRFVTAFYASFYPEENSLVYTSAGHEPPLFFKSDGAYEHLRETELLLGADEEVEYSNVEVELDVGDLLILFSDGITEAMNEDGEMFEREGLIEAVQTDFQERPEHIIVSIFDALRTFLHGQPLTDECTLIIIKRTAV